MINIITATLIFLITIASLSAEERGMDKQGGNEQGGNEQERNEQGIRKEDWRTKAQSCTALSEDDLKNKLTPEQYRITRRNGTELPFYNDYWANKRHGIYVDVVTGEPLFSSVDKFDSGTGWPSFTKPLNGGHVLDREDSSLGMARTEVRSKIGNSHLGHVFNDGPGPDGLRYCINSGALRFVPVEELEQQGYGEYRALFSK